MFYLKRFLCIFKQPSDYELAQRELDDARRRLLEAKAGKDYAIAMEAYHQARIHRLESFISNGKSIMPADQN